MPNYSIQPNDTLSKVASRFYGDATLARKLALYNGIQDPNRIYVGELLIVPSRKELEGGGPKASPAAAPALTVPHGLDGVLSRFGDIYGYIRSDGSISPQWGKDILGSAKIPFPLPLSWARGHKVREFACHKLLVPVFETVFAEIGKKGLQGELRTFGGCYNFRTKRLGSKLSTHCWGIAIDLNPETNQMGTRGDMHPQIVEVFREHGFKWGGDWSRKNKDPMHFQYCTGY